MTAFDRVWYNFNPFWIARSMSTQYTASWCLFHALCRYFAWRGTFKSISSGSLWLLSLGSTDRKNTVCHILGLRDPPRDKVNVASNVMFDFVVFRDFRAVVKNLWLNLVSNNTQITSMSQLRATKTYVIGMEMLSSDNHSWSSRASSQTQLTLSMMDTNLRLMYSCVDSRPSHSTALV